jgi:signal transduction histidine kinase
VRRRILTVALSAVLLAVILLGAPLAVAIRSNAVNQARGELERVALQAAVTVSPTFLGGDPVELPTSRSVDIGLYDPSGAKVTGQGPDALDPELRAALQGSVTDGTDETAYLEAVPVSAEESVIGVVRTASPRADVRATVTKDLLGLTALAVIALLGAGLLAYRQARRLSRPMQVLADAATELGAGNFSVRPPMSGVPEIDRTSAALIATAGQLAEQLDRERAFAAQASHQLRTPLTRLRLELEAGLAGPPAALAGSVGDALGTAEGLTQTVEEVLALARRATSPSEPFEVDALLNQLIASWQGTFASADRPLRLVFDDPPQAAASPAAIRQVVQVLLDNAWRHGEGAVVVTARSSGAALAIDVVDHGQGTVTWPDVDLDVQPLGLTMARSLAESQGGRLLLDSDSRQTRFTVLVPARA